MPNGVKKENLPQKICVVCNRPFTWRKKWERCWDEVTTCSKSCNAKRKKNNQREREKGAYQMYKLDESVNIGVDESREVDLA